MLKTITRKLGQPRKIENINLKTLDLGTKFNRVNRNGMTVSPLVPELDLCRRLYLDLSSFCTLQIELLAFIFGGAMTASVLQTECQTMPGIAGGLESLHA